MKKFFFEKKSKNLLALISMILPVGLAAVLIFGLYTGPVWAMIIVPVMTGVWVLLPWPSHLHNRLTATSWISAGMTLITLSHYYVASDLSIALSLTIYGLIMIAWLLISRKISLTLDEVGLLSIVIAIFLLAYLRNFGTAYAWPTIIGGFCLLAGLLRTRIRHDLSQKSIEITWIILVVLAVASIFWQFMGNTIFKIVFLVIIALLALLIISIWIKSSLERRKYLKALEEANKARLQKVEKEKAEFEAKRQEFLKKLGDTKSSDLSWEDVWKVGEYYYEDRLALTIIREATNLHLSDLLVISNYKKQLVWDRNLNDALEYLGQIARDSYSDQELDKIRLMIEDLKNFITDNKASNEVYEGETNLLGSLNRILLRLTQR